MFFYIDFYFYKLKLYIFISVLVDANPATSSTRPITTKMVTTITTCLKPPRPLSPPPQRRVNMQKYESDDDAGVGGVKKGSNDSGLGTQKKGSRISYHKVCKLPL